MSLVCGSWLMLHGSWLKAQRLPETGSGARPAPLGHEPRTEYNANNYLKMPLIENVWGVWSGNSPICMSRRIINLISYEKNNFGSNSFPKNHHVFQVPIVNRTPRTSKHSLFIYNCLEFRECNSWTESDWGLKPTWLTTNAGVKCFRQGAHICI